MSAALARLVFPDSKNIREIHQEYHVEMIAENTKQLVDYHKESLRLQAGAAAIHLHAQQETNRYLSGIEQECRAMVEGLDSLNESVSEGFAVVGESLERISQQMMQMQRTLEHIAEILSRPYETKVLELRGEADKWLRSGMKTTGRDRDENWKDATRLLHTVVDNPIGMQDYVAWFQTGWLLWKHKKNIPEAEEAFYRTQRLSAQSRDWYHVKSLRHLAYMQYLQDKHADAYGTIQKALDVSRDHATVYDAARYVAKTGREQEYLSLLDRCIELQPTTIITMFSEADFQ